MTRFKLQISAPILFVIFLVSPSLSHTASYEISWTGAKGYRMEGLFRFPDSLMNTGPINASALTFFTIHGFHHEAPLGSFRLGDTPINFNFDTTTGRFPTGGRSESPTGQRWNAPSTNGGFGFFSGNSTQGLYVNGQLIPESEIFIGSTVSFSGIVSSTLEATPVPVSQVPEPNTLVLAGSGIFGILVCRRLMKKAQSNFPGRKTSL